MKIKADKKLSEQIGQNLWNMMSNISDYIVKSDEFPEEVKKSMFRYSIESFKDLSKEEKKSFILAGYFALQNGIDLLTTMQTFKEK